MIFDIIEAVKFGDMDILKWSVASLLLALPIIILALSVHETAHGFIALKLGDHTAKNLNRLTLNPAKHLDPIGFICMLAFGFGWAKPVPVNSRNFKKPRRDMALTAVAGPISNILLAFVFAGLLKLFYLIINALPIVPTDVIIILTVVNLLLSLGIQLNVTLAIFNLLPIPPLDGSKILYMFLPQKALLKFLQYERYISLALLVLLALGVLSYPLSFLADLVIKLFELIFQMPIL